MVDLEFFKGKKILLTGHTGFKGTWMSRVLIKAGADLVGYSLAPVTKPDFFHLSDVQGNMHSIIGDVRDLPRLAEVFSHEKPEIVIHMAAQPIVRDSYKDPVHTYEINVMGTVNVLECIRKTSSVKSFLNVTTDKVYKNNEWEWGYRENETLDGYDPYSNSKSCSELVTHSYRNSFFRDRKIAISTARAGNVIGGGDFAMDRIIPDCVRAVIKGEDIIVRNPHSIRPYQHVLESVMTYLLIVEKQYENSGLQGCYNVGPDEADCVDTGSLVDMFCQKWGQGVNWVNQSDNGPHEANFLKLDCSKLKRTFKWKPTWNVSTALDKVVEWTKIYMNGENIPEVMDRQIQQFNQ